MSLTTTKTFHSRLSSDLININCFAVLALNYKFSRLFNEKVNRGKHCAILNVASLAGKMLIT